MGLPPGYGPGALVRQSQAQFLNCTSFNFCKARAQWPDGNLDQPLKFCAPEMFCLVQGVTPVMGVQGVGEYGRGASILSPPLGGSLVSFCPGRKKLAPQGEIPLRTTNAVRNPPPHPSGLRPATFPPGGRLREKRRNTVSHKILLPTFLLRKVGGGDHPRTDLKFSLMEKAA